MKNDGLYNIWKKEEDIAHIHGWDFSHLYGRYEEESDLPWDYEKIVKQYLSNEKQLMDYDTGGAEFLLSLKHPFHMTSATEGYPPNVELCKELLLPLGVNFKECSTPKNIPFADDSFDLMINRHGDFDPNEIYRLLKTGGIFITEQVGCDNDRDLVKMVLSDVPKPFPQLQRQTQREKFEEAGFQIINTEEAYKPIKFYDIGAFVWYAHIIEWEFPNFSVDNCYEELLKMHETVEKCGKLEGTIHRFLIVAKK